jgi:hypothetical protein
MKEDYGIDLQDVVNKSPDLPVHRKFQFYSSSSRPVIEKQRESVASESMFPSVNESQIMKSDKNDSLSRISSLITSEREIFPPFSNKKLSMPSSQDSLLTESVKRVDKLKEIKLK